MTDYPSIKPEDVREGDVVQLRHGAHRGFAVTEGTVWRTQRGNLLVGNSLISEARDLRLVSRPTPPEPPLRVGDWVRDLSGSEGQITVITDYPDHSPYCVNGQWREGHNLTRIEPPVGWPVGVPDGDAPGGVRWWVRDPGGEYRGRHDGQTGYLEWSDLVAAGGVPALAVTR